MSTLQGFVKIEENTNGSKKITAIVSDRPIFTAREQIYNQLIMGNDRPSSEWYCLQSPSLVGGLSYIRVWSQVLTYIDNAIQHNELEAAIVTVE